MIGIEPKTFATKMKDQNFNCIMAYIQTIIFLSDLSKSKSAIAVDIKHTG